MRRAGRVERMGEGRSLLVGSPGGKTIGKA